MINLTKRLHTAPNVLYTPSLLHSLPCIIYFPFFLTGILMDSATRFSTSGFFHKSVSSKPLEYPSRAVPNFSNFAEIFAAQVYRRSCWPVAKFATGFVAIGAVVHLDLRISPWIFEKFEMTLHYCYFQGLGGIWFAKKTWSKKSRDTVPLRLCRRMTGFETWELHIAIARHAKPSHTSI